MCDWYEFLARCLTRVFSSPERLNRKTPIVFHLFILFVFLLITVFSSFSPFVIFMVSCNIYVVSATASGREDVAATVLWMPGGHCSRMYGYAGPPHYGAVESTAGDPGYLQPGPIPMAMVMPMPAVCEPPQPAPTALQVPDEVAQKRRRYKILINARLF